MPLPRWTSKIAAKIATASRRASTSETIVIASHLKKPAHAVRVRRGELRRRRSPGPADGWRVSQRIEAPASRKNHQASPSRPERRPRQQDRAGDGEEPEADQRPGPVAAVAERRRGDGVVLPLVGDDERRREVDEDAGAAEQREDDEADAEDGGVDVEVAARPPQTPASMRSERLRCRRSDLSDMCVCSVMAPGWRREKRGRPSGMTLSRP